MKRIFHTLMHWYASHRVLPYWSILLVDCMIAILSYYLAYNVMYGIIQTIDNFKPLTMSILASTALYLLCFLLFRTYRGVIRLSTFVDLQKISLAVAGGLVLTYLAGTVFQPASGGALLKLSLPTLLLSALFAIVLMWTARIWGKMLYESYQKRRKNVRVFIFGTNTGGVAIAKSINSQPQLPYRIAGFVSDVRDEWGHHLLGYKIYPADSRLPEVMAKHGASTIVVSPLKTDSMMHNQELVQKYIDAGITLLVMPKAREWDGKSNLNARQLSRVSVEDLLPRHQIEIDSTAIGKQLCGKRILITGAAGSIGSEIVRQVAKFGPDTMILIDQAETPLHDIRLMMHREWPELACQTIVADISNRERMTEIFRYYTPEYVFHAAAYKHVPMMEDNPKESIINNVKGTCILADLSVECGVDKFVMISTDKAVNPTNVMGCSKRLCEIYVQALDKAEKDNVVDGHTQFVTTRFGNVLGSSGSVIPLFKKQIEEGGPVTVTHPDIIRYFMLIPEACMLVLEAGTMGKGGEIFVFDMGNPVKILDLARNMVRLSGAKDVKIVFTGLRDGEKLYEEVLNDKEETKPTFHPKIMIAKVREYDYEKVRDEFSELIEAACREDGMSIVKRMKKIVPEYISRNSIYEKLDAKA